MSSDLSKYCLAVYPAIFIVMTAVVICGMPNMDPVHSMAQRCSTSNFSSALPLQNQNRIFLGLLFLALASFVFVRSKAINNFIQIKYNAAPSEIFTIRTSLSKIFNHLAEEFRRGIINSKIYAPVFSF